MQVSSVAKYDSVFIWQTAIYNLPISSYQLCSYTKPCVIDVNYSVCHITAHLMVHT